MERDDGTNHNFSKYKPSHSVLSYIDELLSYKAYKIKQLGILKGRWNPEQDRSQTEGFNRIRGPCSGMNAMVMRR